MKKRPQFKHAVTQAAYDRIVNDYTISSDGMLTLVASLQNYEIYMEARNQLNAEGLVIGDRRHPVYDVMVGSYKNFLSGMRFLGLDAMPEEVLPGEAEIA
jgi:hypothetical protein